MHPAANYFKIEHFLYFLFSACIFSKEENKDREMHDMHSFWFEQMTIVSWPFAKFQNLDWGKQPKGDPRIYVELNLSINIWRSGFPNFGGASRDFNARPCLSSFG